MTPDSQSIFLYHSCIITIFFSSYSLLQHFNIHDTSRVECGLLKKNKIHNTRSFECRLVKLKIEVKLSQVCQYDMIQPEKK